MLDKIFCNKWAIWFDAAFITAGLVFSSVVVWFSPLYEAHWIRYVLVFLTDIIIIPLWILVWSLKGEVDGWD